MTDSDAPTKAAAEPSMEDILASIRRILSEDTPEAADGAKAEAAPQAAPAPMTPAPEMPADDEHALDIEDSVSAFDMPPAMSAPEATMMTTRAWPDAEPMTHAPQSSRRHDEVFVLTASMRAPMERPLISQPSTDAATDVLSHLAKAILDRRDIAVGARDVTLEDMVRTMLRPMLKEWLDRNLPYLIERLVKKEIDIMINRAERLD